MRRLDVAFFQLAIPPPLLSSSQFREIGLPAIKMLMRGLDRILGDGLLSRSGADLFALLGVLVKVQNSRSNAKEAIL